MGGSLSKSFNWLVGYSSLGVIGAVLAGFRLACIQNRGAAACAIASGVILFGVCRKGPNHSWLYTMFGIGQAPRISYVGGVAPGYERVAAVFQRQFEVGLQLGAQCCVYVNGTRVVDLSGRRDDVKEMSGYGPDSIQGMGSSTKVIESLAIAMLVDRGHLRYDGLLTDVWPEYGQNGKHSTTLAMLMRHEAGVPHFDRRLNAASLTTEAIKNDAVSGIISSQPTKFVPGSTVEYHPFTRGWIANEIFRRAEPHKRTIGEFVQDEVIKPLQLEGSLYIGLPEERQKDVYETKGGSKLWGLVHACLPRCLGGLVYANVLKYILFVVGEKFLMKADAIYVGDEKTSPKAVQTLWGSPTARATESPSVGGIGNARALARIADAMLATTQPEIEGGVRLMSRVGAYAAQVVTVRKIMGDMICFCFSNAGWAKFQKPNSIVRAGGMGWYGFGGSAIQWHEDEQLGFGYTCTFQEYDLDNKLSLELIEAAVACAQALKTKRK